MRTFRNRRPLEGHGAGVRKLLDRAAVVGPRGRRRDVIAASGLNALAALWLVISPWTLGYEPGDPVWNAVVCGLVIGVLATIRVAAPPTGTVLSWINAFLGAWLFTSAFVLDASARADWNAAVAGLAVFYLAIWSGSATDRRVRGRE